MEVPTVPVLGREGAARAKRYNPYMISTGQSPLRSNLTSRGRFHGCPRFLELPERSGAQNFLVELHLIRIHLLVPHLAGGDRASHRSLGRAGFVDSRKLLRSRMELFPRIPHLWGEEGSYARMHPRRNSASPRR